jgi:hypothetical protein
MSTPSSLSDIDPFDLLAREYNQEIDYFNEFDLPLYMQDPNEYVFEILDLLPQTWRYRFGADSALEFYGLEDYIMMTYRFIKEKDIQKIIALSIKFSRPETPEYYGNSPYAVLKMLKYKGAKFNGKIYKLTCSNQCIDSVRILKLFCTMSVSKIQYIWLKYRQRKYNKACQLIQQKVLQWLYRPGGPMMKKFETHFYSITY